MKVAQIIVLMLLFSGWLFATGINAYESADASDETVAAPQNEAARLLRAVIAPAARRGNKSAPVITAVALQPGRAVASTSDGRLIAAAGDDHTVRLWRLRDGKPLKTLIGHDDWVRSVVFTPDGKSLVTAGDDGRVLRWHLDRLEHGPSEIFRQEPTLYDVEIAPDANRVFFVGFDGKLHTVSLNTRRAEPDHACPCRDMRSVVVSPDGQHVACGGRNGSLHLWSLPNWQCSGDLAVHKRRVRSMTFTKDSKWLISAGEDRSIVVIDVATNETVMKLASGPSKILAIASCGDRILASAGSDNKIRLWDLEKQTQLGVLDGHTGSVAALAGNNTVLISGSFDTTIRIWSVGKAVAELQARLERDLGRRIR